jgi:hypothetical protein
MGKRISPPKTEREFQRRVLGAIEKPKTNGFWATLNRPFTLWAMSLVLLTAGSAYFNTYQQCQKDAQDEIAKFTKLQRELYEREQHIREAIVAGRSIAEINRSLSQPYSFYAEFSSYRFPELREAYNELSGRIIDWQLEIHHVINEKMVAFDSIIQRGSLPADLTERGLDGIKEDAEILPFFYTRTLVYNDLVTAPLGPACGPSNLLDRVISGTSARIVRSFLFKKGGSGQ